MIKLSLARSLSLYIHTYIYIYIISYIWTLDKKQHIGAFNFWYMEMGVTNFNVSQFKCVWIFQENKTIQYGEKYIGDPRRVDTIPEISNELITDDYG